jgi:hypothetical protein
MANDTIVFEAQVKGINNIKDLRQALKDAKNELLQFEAGTDGFNKAQAKVSALKDKLDGLGDSTRIQGTGVERLGQSFSLMAESAGSFDGDKFKTALTGIGQAMSAIPIFLLIQSLQLLYQNMDKVTEFFNSFIGSTDKTKVAIEDLTFEIDKQTAMNKLLKASLEGEIAIMEAQGVSIDKIIAKKKELADVEIKEIERTIELNKLRLEQEKNTVSLGDKTKTVFAGVLAALGLSNQAVTQANQVARERIERQQEIANKIIESEAQIKKIKDGLTVDEINAEKSKTEAVRKSTEDTIKERERLLEYERRRAAEMAALDEQQRIALYESEAAKLKATEDAANEAKRISDELNGDIFAAQIRLAQREEALAKEQAAKEIEIAKKKEAAKRQAQDLTFSAGRMLSQALFQYQINQAEGNDKKQNELRKKAFELDKAFQIGQATIDGYRSVTGALAQTGTLGPAAVALAVANGVYTAALIAKIASTKFESGTSSSAPTIEAPTQVSVPSVSQQQQTRQGSTLLDNQGNPISQQERDTQMIQAYLLTHDVENKLNSSNRTKQISRI